MAPWSSRTSSRRPTARRCCRSAPFRLYYLLVEQISNEIRVGHADRALNALLDSIGTERRSFSRHFSQGEDFFLHLDAEYRVPHFLIHHDVRRAEPSTSYSNALEKVVGQVAGLAPQVFKGLAYFFDPAEILRPCFYSVYSAEDSLYLYILRMDLMMRATESTVTERGTNDTTPAYASRRVFLEASLIPLEAVVRRDEKVQAFRIRQTISQTWIGEFGRGYFQQGIWMDADLTKFFSRLFLPAGKRVYPYFPYQCRYKTICQSLVGLDPESRAAAIPILHRSLEFLLPVLEQIQAEMKNSSFSEELEIYRQLKEKVPSSWYDAWRAIRVEAYLNESDMREFRIED